ncbi:MAG: radical SAM protein, partial [Thermodesulfobacteriota bacterium]
SGCTLQCTFCQNHQISRGGRGEPLHLDQLSKRIKEMIYLHQVHNLNLVTADHFLPHALRLVDRLKADGFNLPVVFNLSGYQSLPWLKMAADGADIYLPDFKYTDARLAGRLSASPKYPETALEAISEMVRQKGFLDTFSNGAEIAKKGVLVRHLILPGYVHNSINALSSLFLEFGKDLPLSLMSQYYPVVEQTDPRLNRTIADDEFHQVYAQARALGFRNLFVQFPEKGRRKAAVPPALVPDFQKTVPFG